VITKVLDGTTTSSPTSRCARPGSATGGCSARRAHGPVSSLETLREALSLPDPQESCDRLVQLALRGGGPDNVTVIVADVVDDGEPDAAPVVGGAAAEAPQEAPPGIADSAASRARVAEGRDTPPRKRPAAAPLRGVVAVPRWFWRSWRC